MCLRPFGVFFTDMIGGMWDYVQQQTCTPRTALHFSSDDNPEFNEQKGSFDTI